MSTNANTWNESMIDGWTETQRKYWETWSDYAKNIGMGAFGAGIGHPSAGNPFAGFNLFSANPFGQNMFAQNPFVQNPFHQNMFAQNPFVQNPIGQNMFAQSPFVQNPFAGNPFAQSNVGENPFSGMLEQWLSSVRPEAQGDIRTVVQRVYDMGKSFMSMSEGLFGASGQGQPDAAMNMWMSSMQAALQQWIAQIQANADFATPDLPGVSGTTLSSWARIADSVSPWLNMSQGLLKEIAEGHLPGGVEIPGVGAAQEQFLRALSMPGLGYTREQQEHLQGLARNLLKYHDALRAYKLAFAKTALASLESVQKRLHAMHEKGEKIESLRGLYDMWVDASEEAYGDFATSDEYQVVYGDLVNALMQVRKDMNELAEQHYKLMNIPTRAEINTMQHRQQENRRENRHLRREVAELRAEIEKLASARPAAGRGNRKSPAEESLPIDNVEDDLTAIKGIGPKMAEKLYEQGIKNFSNLAAMNAKFAEELDEALKTQGRILRDDWIGQAKKLRR